MLRTFRNATALLIYVAAYSSLRLGELTGLRRCDVNPLHKTVTVARQITEVRGQLHVGPPKTASSKRAPYGSLISSPRCSTTIYSATASPAPKGLVFPAAEGGPMRRTNFRRRVWVPATEAAGVPGLRFHDLRHAVGLDGFEPSTSSLSGMRSNQLSYSPLPSGAS